MNGMALHHTVIHDGRYLRARILCDVWLYTDSPYRISRGDVVARMHGLGEPPTYYVVEEVLVTNGEYQKFRLARMPA
ncbi:hypothetical protein SEA_HORTUS1_110 [Microbacterium phage Hortus1]|nr:hypothetical protein SEA_HORTUS1_110 [Microbacterium phage Hortus1]AWY05680.1 hypothetical protein SEA_OLINDD_110 [Microbacterium phage OlinDD]QAU07439.1 hypothetical protein SEA_ALLEB_107 [Microbacterium phage Alleb]